MSISAYYRAQAQRCLALSRTCSDGRQGAQLSFMADRYFENAINSQERSEVVKIQIVSCVDTKSCMLSGVGSETKMKSEV